MERRIQMYQISLQDHQVLLVISASISLKKVIGIASSAYLDITVQHRRSKKLLTLTNAIPATTARRTRVLQPPTVSLPALNAVKELTVMKVQPLNILAHPVMPALIQVCSFRTSRMLMNPSTVPLATIASLVQQRPSHRSWRKVVVFALLVITAQAQTLLIVSLQAPMCLTPVSLATTELTLEVSQQFSMTQMDVSSALRGTIVKTMVLIKRRFVPRAGTVRQERRPQDLRASSVLKDTNALVV